MNEDTLGSETNTKEAEIEDLGRDSVPFSVPLSAIARFVLPVALLLLSANYIRETWGRIRIENLQYPYFVIGVMAILLLLVIAEESQELREMDTSVSTAEALKEYAEHWRVSIGFAAVAIAYAWVIPITGFFSASVAALIAAMYVAGVRNYKMAAIVVIGIIGLVWVMFVEIVGINPPTGFIDELVL